MTLFYIVNKITMDVFQTSEMKDAFFVYNQHIKCH